MAISAGPLPRWQLGVAVGFGSRSSPGPRLSAGSSSLLDNPRSGGDRDRQDVPRRREEQRQPQPHVSVRAEVGNVDLTPVLQMKVSSRSSTTAKTERRSMRHRARHHPITQPWPAYWATRQKGSRAPTRQVHAASAGQAGRAVPALRGPPADRRSATELPRAMGTMVAARRPRAITASYLVHHGRPGPAGDDQTRPVHASCQRERHARQRKNPAPQLQPATPSRLA